MTRVMDASGINAANGHTRTRETCGIGVLQMSYESAAEHRLSTCPHRCTHGRRHWAGVSRVRIQRKGRVGWRPRHGVGQYPENSRVKSLSNVLDGQSTAWGPAAGRSKANKRGPYFKSL